MSARAAPKILSIPSGVPFLPTLADALLDGRLVEGFRLGADPLALADVTIYVPTRRAARELRSVFMERTGGGSVILPQIRPLGEFDEDDLLFSATGDDLSDMAPPIPAMDRLLALAPLARAWKSRLPAEVASLFAEPLVIPASAADSLWLARDLAALMDEVETEGADWLRLGKLVSDELAGWWQVTLDFLRIVTKYWPEHLTENGLSNPAAYRNALIRRHAAWLEANPPPGPVIAAGSTGSIPATAELLSIISRLPLGAVVLPGLDQAMDAASWSVVSSPAPEPAVLGHPQYGLAKLLRLLGVTRDMVEEIVRPDSERERRGRIVSEAFRPSETTENWVAARAGMAQADLDAALSGITLVEAAHERDEAVAIAIALRMAIETPGHTAALVTGDRELARRVSSELLRFGIRADDSGGTPLAITPPAGLLRLMVEAVFRPGDPVTVLSLIKHPLLSLGLPRAMVRRAAEAIELVALRGGVGRPDAVTLLDLFEARLEQLAEASRKPYWLARMNEERLSEARSVLAALQEALSPLAAHREQRELALSEVAAVTVTALEALARTPDGGPASLYDGDAGEKLASLLRDLVSATTPFGLSADEWPDVLAALVAPETVKPAQGADSRVAIWGALEARLLSPDTLVVGGLNEGVWPRQARADRFMSRIMKAGIDLEPPERRIGQGAHDLQMALGARNVVLTRAARSGDAPAVASRWLQRILTFAGADATEAMRGRGTVLLGLTRALDERPRVKEASRPEPKPDVTIRPKSFSVTEIETLRRDPYAVYARRILGLSPLDPLLRDPGAAERGTLFHAILHRFATTGVDPAAPNALETLLEAGRSSFAEMTLPPEVEAVWWPRFAQMAPRILDWENSRANAVQSRHPEERATKTVVGATGVTLSGYADRVDLLPGNAADIIDYKTGTTPSKTQAHRLLAPQLALEAALLQRGAFEAIGPRQPADLAYIRLKASGEVIHESILSIKGSLKTAPDLAQEAWKRLEEMLDHFALPTTGYKSRALPFREGVEGDYDHLARVLEWSAGGDDGLSGEDGE